MLSKKQVETAKKQIDINSDDQHYFDTFENKAKHERDICDRQQINRMIDNGILIPFVPCYEL